jgi:outer membrane protein assembly factor BamB
MKTLSYTMIALAILSTLLCCKDDTGPVSENPTVSLKWRYRTVGPSILYGYGNGARLQPVIRNGFLYVDAVGKMFKFSLDGILIWETRIRTDSLSTPERSLLYCESTQSLYFTNVRQVHAVDIATGAIRWTLSLPSESGWGLHAMSSSKVFIGCNDGVLYAVDKQSGTLSWSRIVRQNDERMMSVSWRDGSIYCSMLGLDSTNQERGYLAVVNESTQAITFSWQVPREQTGSGGVITQVAFWNNRVIVSASNGHLYAIDTLGNIFWKVAVWASESTPVVRNDRIYITATDTYVSCVSPSNGSFVWRVRTPGSKSQPTDFNSWLLATDSGDGKCYLFSQQTGSVVWSGYGLDYPGDRDDVCLSPPALTERELVFVTPKYIYCFSIHN